MNQSYLNGPLHELAKRLRRTTKLRDGNSNYWIIQLLSFTYHYIRYQWSNPDGPVFMLKLWILILDLFFKRLYPLNQNLICRSPNHSSVLSKKQNIGWFLKYNLHFRYKDIQDLSTIGYL